MRVNPMGKCRAIKKSMTFLIWEINYFEEQNKWSSNHRYIINKWGNEGLVVKFHCMKLWF